MANSSSNLDQITSGQAAKEIEANELFDAHSPASIFGRHASASSSLQWGYYGGPWVTDGVLSTIANGQVALTASSTNYVEADRTGAVTANTTGFTAGRLPLYEVVTNASAATSWTDRRHWVRPRSFYGRAVRNFGSDANITLTAAEARCDIVELTGTLSATRNVVVPLGVQRWTIFNNTSGGQSVQVIGASGTGVTIANAKRADVYSDGTNVNRITADNP